MEIDLSFVGGGGLIISHAKSSLTLHEQNKDKKKQAIFRENDDRGANKALKSSLRCAL